MRARGPELLLGEWACLGILVSGRAHGFAVARRLAPTGDLGRIWSLSRPLTYRALATLEGRGLIRVVATEPGGAGGDRRVLGPTPAGRATFRRWVHEPVAHLREVRSELLMKLALCKSIGIDPCPLVAAQRVMATELAEALHTAGDSDDAVAIWREEASEALLRFIDRLPC